MNIQNKIYIKQVMAIYSMVLFSIACSGTGQQGVKGGKLCGCLGGSAKKEEERSQRLEQEIKWRNQKDNKTQNYQQEQSFKKTDEYRASSSKEGDREEGKDDKNTRSKEGHKRNESNWKR